MPVGFFKHLICLYDWWIECELLLLVDMSGDSASVRARESLQCHWAGGCGVMFLARYFTSGPQLS